MSSIEYLKKIGFKHRYKPSLKRIDLESLGYWFLCKDDSIVTIELKHNVDINVWRVDNISFSGKEAYKVLKKDLKDYSLESVVKFVEKYSLQTF